MKKKFTFVVATPSLNQGRYLSQTIKSVWMQKGDFLIKHVVADGGSTDNSVDILKQYQTDLKKNKFKICCLGILFDWKSKKDKGQTSAIAEVFKSCSGDIYCWLNSDDYLKSDNIFATVKNIFEQQKPNIITGDAIYVKPNGVVIGRHYSATILKNEGFVNEKNLKLLEQFDIFSQPSTFFDKSIAKENRLDEEFFYCMDWDLWLRAMRNHATFYKINRVLSCMRRHSESKTNKFGEKYFREKNIFYSKHKLYNINFVYSFLKLRYLSTNNKVVRFLIMIIIRILKKIKKTFWGSKTIVG